MPATGVRTRRPGSRLRHRRSATSGVSGPDEGAWAGRPGHGAAKKGGCARAAPGPELVDHLSQGVVSVSELGGDLLEGTALDEVGPQRLIASVEGLVGLEEVAEA